MRCNMEIDGIPGIVYKYHMAKSECTLKIHLSSARKIDTDWKQLTHMCQAEAKGLTRGSLLLLCGI